jgi:hypothetical protein
MTTRKEMQMLTTMLKTAIPPLMYFARRLSETHGMNYSPVTTPSFSVHATPALISQLCTLTKFTSSRSGKYISRISTRCSKLLTHRHFNHASLMLLATWPTSTLPSRRSCSVSTVCPYLVLIKQSVKRCSRNRGGSFCQDTSWARERRC